MMISGMDSLDRAVAALSARHPDVATPTLRQLLDSPYPFAQYLALRELLTGGQPELDNVLLDKLEAYALQENGKDTVEANLDLGLPADAREYSPAAQILRDLGINSVRLLTNNPGKVVALENGGVKVIERLSLTVPINDSNRSYLQAKADKLGHLL